jgi:hypothetical protein
MFQSARATRSSIDRMRRVLILSFQPLSIPSNESEPLKASLCVFIKVWIKNRENVPKRSIRSVRVDGLENRVQKSAQLSAC